MAYLAQQRAVLRIAAYGLTDEQARAVPTRSALSVGGLIKHVTAVERRLGRHRAPATPGGAGRPRAGREADYTDGFRMRPARDAGRAARRLQDAAARETERALMARLDLGRPVPVPRDVPWFPRDVDAWSVRWVLLHLIQETARHAGHADIVREQHRRRHGIRADGRRRGVAGDRLAEALAAAGRGDGPDAPDHGGAEHRRRPTPLGRPGRLRRGDSGDRPPPRRPGRGRGRFPRERGADAGPGRRRCGGHGRRRGPRHRPRVGVVPLAGQASVAASPAGVPAGVDAALRPHRLRHRPDAGGRARPGPASPARRPGRC